ncbi:TPA: aminotransferase class I/II-fold pyridoxal phosphate-dependent enzyme [Streptococcus equi subsp. zooepidemicus]|nr:aminotransferase class I/II-fold pyridoxal phosphate-dependent enzyme [Streptococcus equi subsp. zooepidemicus]
MKQKENRWPEWPRSNVKHLQKMKDVLESNRWSISGYENSSQLQQIEFQRKFNKKLGCSNSILCTNGTAALTIALESLNLEKDSEVIVPLLTWMATPISVLEAGGKPVFVDINPDSLCIDEKLIVEKITEKTKAILIVHLYGYLANIDSILDICKKYNLTLIEDCAHVHFAEWKGKCVGQFGDFGAFSMQQGKVLTSGEGGALTYKDKYKERVSCLVRNSRVFNPKVNYFDMNLVSSGNLMGSNRCISEFQAAILNVEIDEFDNYNIQRNTCVEYIRGKLANSDCLQLLPVQKNVSKNVYYGLPIVIKRNVNLDKVIEIVQNKLKLGTFQIHRMYQPLDNNFLYCPEKTLKYNIEKLKYNCKSNAQIMYDKVIILHHSVLLSDEQLINNLLDSLEQTVKQYEL